MIYLRFLPILLIPLCFACGNQKKTASFSPPAPRAEVRRFLPEITPGITTVRVAESAPDERNAPISDKSAKPVSLSAGSTGNSIRTSATQAVHRDVILRKSREYLGAKYKYGGTSSKGFDCSGFTSCVFKEAGFIIPRTSGEQSRFGNKKKVNHAQPGDLIFFGSGGVDHVGIVLESSKRGLMVIHSTRGGGVQIDNVLEVDYWRRKILWAADPYGELISDGTK